MPAKAKLATRSLKSVAPALIGEVRGFGRVNDRLALALVGEPPPRERMSAAAIDGDQTTVPVRAIQIPIPDSDGTSLVVLWTAFPQRPLPPTGALLLELSDGPTLRVPGMLGDSSLELTRFVSGHLAGLPASIRQAALERTLDLAADSLRHDDGATDGLLRLRDALRIRLPAVEVGPTVPCAINVEALWRVDDQAFYLEGWLLDRRSTVERLSVVTPEGRTIDVLDGAFRHARADVSEFFGVSPRQKLGFITYLETPEPSRSAEGWVLQAHDGEGGGIEVEMPPVRSGGAGLRNVVLQDLELEALPADALKVRHIVPTLTRLERRLQSEIEIDSVDQFGAAPANPEVTIVVPLYQRLEFLEQQLAQFVHDPEIIACDLVYVLDSAWQADYARSLALQLHRLYEVPFRLACLSANGGFSVANNHGASLAAGRLLLLLNSDVLPDQPGWLSAMTEFHDSKPSIGAVAPKLLYEDDSIQHAGLYFDRPSGAHVWSNEHYFKGLHRGFAQANVAREVPAVTGACLMIETELYRAIGGLRGMYIRGDYEDSDLCLRLRELGREIWYMPDVELYHLEGQSYPSADRAATSAYNRWLQTHLWRGALQEEDDR